MKLDLGVSPMLINNGGSGFGDFGFDRDAWWRQTQYPSPTPVSPPPPPKQRCSSSSENATSTPELD